MGSFRAADAEKSSECTGRRSKDHEREYSTCCAPGCRGADLPERYRPYTTAYNRFNPWSRRGIWKRIFDTLASKSRDSLYRIDSTIVKAHRAASGAKGGAKAGDRHQPRRSLHKNRRHRQEQGPPAELHGTGGEVHDSQVVGDDSIRPDRPWPLPPTRPTTARKCGSRSKTKSLCRPPRAAAMPSRKPIVPRASSGHKIENYFWRIKDGGASPPATTNSPDSLPPPPSSVLSIGSSCESRP
jgi:hypothetical protein